MKVGLIKNLIKVVIKAESGDKEAVNEYLKERDEIIEKLANKKIDDMDTEEFKKYNEQIQDAIKIYVGGDNSFRK